MVPSCLDRSVQVCAVAGMCLALATMPGCIVGGDSSTLQTGSYVSPATVSMIEPGKTSRSWVRTMLGEPTARVTEESRELWRYSFSRVTTSSGFVLVVFHGSNRDEVSQTTFVEFEGDIVRRVWQEPNQQASRAADDR